MKWCVGVFAQEDLRRPNTIGAGITPLTYSYATLSTPTYTLFLPSPTIINPFLPLSTYPFSTLLLPFPHLPSLPFSTTFHQPPLFLSSSNGSAPDSTLSTLLDALSLVDVTQGACSNPLVVLQQGSSGGSGDGGKGSSSSENTNENEGK